MNTQAIVDQLAAWANTIWTWLANNGLRIVIILVLAVLAYRLWGLAVKRLEAMVHDEDPEVSALEKRASTISSIAHSAGFVVIFAVATMMILEQVGLDVTPILAGAGVVGLAIGFGAQSLVKDILAGFFILLEDQFRVGDSIQVGGIAGIVERMNVRTTVVRDLEGTMHVVPNGEIRIVSNRTRKWARAVVDVGVAYESDLGHVTAVLEDIGRELAADPAWAENILEPPAVVGVQSLDESWITMRTMVKCAPGEQWGLGRELRRRIKDRFEREGIDMPYPQQVIHVRREG